MGYSPTEYAEFTEPPAEMSSHGFLLRRVWHLAIPTPPAMGYSPTEYAEFTEPHTEMSSHGFHRFTQILRVRCSPTEYAEFTEFGSVGMAGMPYPPTSVLIRVICGSPFSARGSVSSVCSVGISFLPRISQIYTAAPPGLAAWVWQGCHTLLRHLEPSLLHVLPVLWVRLRHHLRLVDAQPREHDGSRCERHRHAVVVVRVDRL